MKQKLTEMDKSTITLGDFLIHHAEIDKIDQKQIIKIKQPKQ